MTRRERILAALQYRKPDSTPYHVDFTHQMLAKMNTFAQCEDYTQRIDNHICTCSLSKPEVEIQPEFFMDEFGVVWNRSGADKDIGVVDAPMLAQAEDLTGFSLPPVDEAFIRSQVDGMLQHAGDRFTVASLGFSLFERAWTLRGMENLLCDMLISPDFVHKLLEMITQRNLEILDIVLEYPVDAVYFGDDWGQQQGLIMGPKCWRTFLKPCLKQMYDKVHAKGRYVIQHSCGDIREVMEELMEMGLNIYQTFQPEIYGLDYAKKLYGKLTIWGGISTQRDLPAKTPEEVKAITRELLAAFPHGGLIASPTHAVPGDVPPENIAAMLDVLANP